MMFARVLYWQKTSTIFSFLDRFPSKFMVWVTQFYICNWQDDAFLALQTLENGCIHSHPCIQFYRKLFSHV